MTDSCYNYSEKQEFQKMEFLDTVKLAFSKPRAFLSRFLQNLLSNKSYHSHLFDSLAPRNQAFLEMKFLDKIKSFSRHFRKGLSKPFFYKFTFQKKLSTVVCLILREDI